MYKVRRGFYARFLFYWRLYLLLQMEVLSISSKELSINEEIKLKEVRLVGPDGEQLGVLSSRDALEKAYALGLDLVLIAPTATPPVCRIMDYGKYRYDRDKKEKEARKKQKIVEIKEIQLTCLIDTNDFNTKVNHARRFLTDGNKVKVMVKFKGRQMSRQDVGRDLLDRFKEACSDLGNMEKAPVLDGRNMIMFIAPAKTAAAK